MFFVCKRRSSCFRSVSVSLRQSLPLQVSKSNAKKHGVTRRKSKSLNSGLPFLSTISPSRTACLRFGSEAAICSARSAKEAKGCPFREINRARPCSITASARKPSYFNSKTHSGSSKGALRRCNGMGCNWKNICRVILHLMVQHSLFYEKAARTVARTDFQLSRSLLDQPSPESKCSRK